MAVVLSLENRLPRKQESPKAEPKRRGGGITRKRGSNKLYIDFYYFGERVEQTSGFDDTPENMAKLSEWW